MAWLPTNLLAQSAHQPRGIGVWIEEARASPFHDRDRLRHSAKLATGLVDFDEGVGFLDMVRPPITPLPELPDSALSFGKVFGYTLPAAFVPMVPALITIASGSTAFSDMIWFLGGYAVTLVSVPVAAMAAGTTSVPRAMCGAAIGFLAGLVSSGFLSSALGDYSVFPLHSVPMAAVAAEITYRH